MTFWEKKANLSPSLIESDGSFLTKPTDIVNYFNYFLIDKISKLRDDMPATNADTLKQFCCLSTMTSHRGLTIWMENY